VLGLSGASCKLSSMMGVRAQQRACVRTEPHILMDIMPCSLSPSGPELVKQRIQMQYAP
jgi:hypothetical protein